MDREHKKKIEKAADILKSLLAGRNWQKRIDLHQVFLFWNEAVGPDIAAHAEPEIIRGTVLWIRVTDSVWMQQLHLLKTQLLERLNSRLKEEKLSDLRFQLDVHAGAESKQLQQKRKKRKKIPAVPPPLDKMIGLLDSGDMQDALRSLYRKAHERENEKE